VRESEESMKRIHVVGDQMHCGLCVSDDVLEPDHERKCVCIHTRTLDKPVKQIALILRINLDIAYIYTYIPEESERRERKRIF
jgi:hypothetical protein